MCKTASPLVNSTSVGVTNTRGMVNAWWLFTTFEGSNGDTQYPMAHLAIYTLVVTLLVLWLLCSCLYLCRGSLWRVLIGVMSKFTPSPGSTYSTNGQSPGRRISDGDTHSRKAPKDVKTYTEIETIRGWGITQNRKRKRICFPNPRPTSHIIYITLQTNSQPIPG